MFLYFYPVKVHILRILSIMELELCSMISSSEPVLGVDVVAAEGRPATYTVSG